MIKNVKLQIKLNILTDPNDNYIYYKKIVTNTVFTRFVLIKNNVHWSMIVSFENVLLIMCF